MDTKFFKLSNGLPVIYVCNRGAALVHACFTVNAGAKNSPKDKAGLAHALEHLLLVDIIRNDDSAISSNIAGSTDENLTTFDFSVLRQDYARVLQALGQAMVTPNFVESNWQSERQVIFEEMRCDTDDDDVDLLCGYGFKTHQVDVVGSHKSVERITLDDLQSFWRQYYTAPNCVLCICGDCDDCEAWAEQSFGLMRNALAPIFVKPTFSGKICCKEEREDKVELALYFDASGAPQDELTMLAHYLGGLTTVGLFRALRAEQKLVYRANCYVCAYSYGTLFEIETTCSKHNFEQVAHAIGNELRALCSQELSAKVLTAARDSQTIEYYRLAANAPELLESYADDWFCGNFVPMAQRIADLQNISPAALKNTANKLFAGKTPLRVITGSIGMAKAKKVLADALSL